MSHELLLTVLLIDDYLLYMLLIKPPIDMGRIVLESIRDMCIRELSDEGTVHEKILELQLRYELDEITEEAYKKEEAKLMARLRKIREAKQKEMWGEDIDESEEVSKKDKGKTLIDKKEGDKKDTPSDNGGNKKKEYI